VNKLNKITVDTITHLIELNSNIVDFGSPEDAVDDGWIKKAENILGVKLPESYILFLKNYSGGEIGGEEVFSIYGMEFEAINGGDIVYQHIVNLRNGLTDPDRIVVTETDLGEVFFFDYSHFDGEECPIYLRLPSGDSELYATNFFEFLQKRIETHSR
jgi:hypothetical protein